MQVQNYINKMKKVQDAFLNYIEEEQEGKIEENHQNIIQLFNDYKLNENKHDLKEIIYIIRQISNYHYRSSNFFDKIEKILLIFTEDMKKFFSNIEIFDLFQLNKRILLFLIEEKVLIIDKSISDLILSEKFKKADYLKYFSNELKPFVDVDALINQQTMNQNLYNNSLNTSLGFNNPRMNNQLFPNTFNQGMNQQALYNQQMIPCANFQYANMGMMLPYGMLAPGMIQPFPNQGLYNPMNQLYQQMNQFGNQQMNQFGNQQMNQFGNQQMNQFGNQQMNQFGNQQMNQFGNQQMNQFGNQQMNQFGSQQMNQFGSQQMNQFGNQQMNQNTNQLNNNLSNKENENTANQLDLQSTKEKNKEINNNETNDKAVNEVNNKQSNEADDQIKNEQEEQPSDDKNSNSQSDSFEEKRKIGENDNYICELIRKDMIDDFISHVNKNSISLSSSIPPSIFETNPLLLKYEKTRSKNYFMKYRQYRENDMPTLIEYAAFFGSIQIFKYLYLNKASISSSIWNYAIHSQNAELINYFEENKIKFIDNPFEKPKRNNFYYEKCLKKSLKCFHIDVSNYIINNFLPMNEERTVKILLKCYKYHNYAFIEQNDINNNLIGDLCQFDYYSLIEAILKEGNININKLTIINYYFQSDFKSILL